MEFIQEQDYVFYNPLPSFEGAVGDFFIREDNEGIGYRLYLFNSYMLYFIIFGWYDK